MPTEWAQAKAKEWLRTSGLLYSQDSPRWEPSLAALLDSVREGGEAAAAGIRDNVYRREAMEHLERAEKAKAEVERLRARNNANVLAYSQELTERTTQLQRAEAKLAKVVGWLGDCLTVMDADSDKRVRDLARKIRAALAAVKDKDDTSHECHCRIGSDNMDLLICDNCLAAAKEETNP